MQADYLTNASLDGYIEDDRGAFDWFPTDDEVFACTTGGSAAADGSGSVRG